MLRPLLTTAPVAAALFVPPALSQIEGARHEHVAHARVGAQAVAIVTSVAPAIGGRSRSEAQLVQPMLHGHVMLWGGRVLARGALNLEGLTIPNGEPTPGIYGEGFVDRRHPHTYLHELVAVVRGRAGVDLSLAVGRGFAPFGTDDPMVRTLIKYPVNHHLAQILERAVLIAAARRGAVVAEVALFNGDEPERPEDMPNLDRFGDSWASRVTLRPRRWAEAQASYAWVRSPEWAAGFGADHRKQSASLRLSSSSGMAGALLEWAQTDVFDDGRQIFRYRSLLAEGGRAWGPVTLAARLERTDRPDEERLADPFRSLRPHEETTVLGVTRWSIARLQVGTALRFGRLRTAPFIEVAMLEPRARFPLALFQPRAFYGDGRLWETTAGVRIVSGMTHRRMGRYGVADLDP